MLWSHSHLLKRVIVEAKCQTEWPDLWRAVQDALFFDSDELGPICAPLAPQLPQSGGRPLSARSVTHAIITEKLQAAGEVRRYTLSLEYTEGKPRYVDPLSRAAELEFPGEKF